MKVERSESRRFHSYCVGTGKTGTHSIAGIFDGYRSAHEPESHELVALAIGAARGQLSLQELENNLCARDARLLLEMESDGTLCSFMDVLVRLFPQSRYILTIRDCFTWLDSVLNHNVVREPHGFWRAYDDMKYAAWDFSYTDWDRILEAYGLRTVRHYLSHWAAHNRKVITSVPADRLMVVRTDRIEQSVPEIASFIGISAATLNVANAHLFSNPNKIGLLARIDPGFVRECVEEYCQPLMRRYFPDIEDLSAVTGGERDMSP